jgi:hypothetical protein
MNKFYLTLSVLVFAQLVQAQKLDVKETWASGYARSLLYNDVYTNDTEVDTVSAKRQMSGHTLVDLAVNIKPSDKVFVQGMVRVRNDHGGFWGSGVTFDVRNLYLRGLVGKGFRYQIGDINYKLTPYTLFNSDEEFSANEPKVFSLMREMNRYDLFYDENNSWRQQGVTGEFGLQFKEYIEEMDFTLFTTRLNSTDNNGLLDRLQSGGSVFLRQSKFLDFRATYIDAYDVLGTSASADRFNNPVLTAGVGLHAEQGDWKLDLASEFGQSKLKVEKEDKEVDLEDHFSDFELQLYHSVTRVNISLGYQNVGTGFRSIGAQTKRLNFNRTPLSYSRYGNEQSLRAFGLMDIMRDASIYQTELSSRLMPYDPAYGNAQPYGRATPNRSNISLGLDWKGADEEIEIGLGAIMGSEVVGQGTESLRDFMTINTDVIVHLDKMIGSEKHWTLSAGLWYETTDRSGEAAYENVELDNSMIDLGMEYEFIKDFEILGGIRMMSAQGNESTARRNIVDDIITFEEYDIDMQQTLLGLGLRYNFSETALIDIHGTGYAYTDDLNLASDYSLSNFSIIYRMKF